MLAAAGQAMAQTAITGTVRVPEGASVEGTRVVAFDPTTNKTFQGTLDAAGAYSITVEPGTYTVVVYGRGMGTQTFQNVQVAEGQSVPQDVTLQASQPLCIVKAAAPIPLADDISSASFADAPDIVIGSGANIVEGIEGIANFRGPASAGGRFRIKYSEQGLHIAGDVALAKPNTNFGSDAELWKGNSLEILFQDDPFNATRNQPDPAHNFRVAVALTNPPRWRFGANLEQTPQLEGQNADIAQYVSVKDRADGMGNLVRVDIPWAFLMTGGENPTALQPPADNAMAALDIRLNTTTPEATAEAPARQFQLAWSGFGGTDPRGLVPIQFCPQAPQ
jgi:hypothetical protein